MIFFFSATGNSQYAAQRVAAATGDSVVSIGVAMKDRHFAFDVTEDERIGFVVPTFAWTLPGVVASFINKLELTGYRDKYVYAIFTCGESCGGGPAAIRELLGRKGIGFSGGFELVTIDNFIVWSTIPSEEEVSRKLKAADVILDEIIKSVCAKKSGIISGEYKNLYMPFECFSSSDGTSKLIVSDDCVGCGLCVMMCPTGAIKMNEEEGPYWDGECSLCLACLHRCPVSAIDYGTDTVGKRRWKYPGLIPQTINKY
ncbi:MAG: 4Fe-4S binding protein [Clostridiales bacterium]|nr:4Fe-4S binding protein [Clostridiales bacterium]